MDPIEAVADALMKFEGWTPGSRSYRNRNPGNLEGGSVVDPQGYNVYQTLIDGYKALTNDLFDKFSGNNHHGLGPDSTVIQLMNIYAPPSDNNPTEKYAEFMASWVSKALNKQITINSKLREIVDYEQVSTT